MNEEIELAENEKEVKMIEIELDLEEKTIDGLLEYAKINILNDRDALINWAANDILQKIVDSNGEILKEEEK